MQGKKKLTWYRDIDTDLTGFNVSLEPSGSTTVAREDGHAVAVLVCVDEFDSIVDRRDVDAHEDGAEYFFLVAAHVWFNVRDYRWADLRSTKGISLQSFLG